MTGKNHPHTACPSCLQQALNCGQHFRPISDLAENADLHVIHNQGAAERVYQFVQCAGNLNAKVSQHSLLIIVSRVTDWQW
jgi:hypothetical protein